MQCRLFVQRKNKIKITQRYTKVLKISEHAYDKIERMKLPKISVSVDLLTEGQSEYTIFSKIKIIS
jgi:S-adenosylhomocysteine hydrolase